MSPVSAEVCQFRARSVGYRMGLTGNDGDGFGTMDRPGKVGGRIAWFSAGQGRSPA